MAKYINIADGDYSPLDDLFSVCDCKKIFLVCDNSLQFLNVSTYIQSLRERTGIEVVSFSDFQPNPQYESVVEGVKKFNANKCNIIFAIGGGSTIDVAKCIKLYCNMDHEKNYLKQRIVMNDIKLVVLPTTAGTGSEATRYAVIYFNNEKQSIADYSCIPSVVIFDGSVLKSLPTYQKKVTMLDALCHAIESYWSVNSNDESKIYAKRAIKLIIKNKDGYLSNRDETNIEMLEAANLAGKAINITQTTAGHAMCYKLTSLYGIAHGHSAAMVDKVLWDYMLEHTDKCLDPRGEKYLIDAFRELAACFGCEDSKEGQKVFAHMYDSLDLLVPKVKENDYMLLRTSVNPIRLKNNPIKLDIETLDELYHKILSNDIV